MFKLQRLEITGFKSFSDYTEIIFTGNGITAVVGPNGCGKSNISDSITWVLGEQRAKNLRGGEMQDVIFAGTKSRQPSGMAEVVLHLVRVESETDALEAVEIDDIDEALSDFDEHAVEIDEFDSQIQNQENGHQAAANGNGFHAETVETATLAASPKNKSKRHWKPRRAALDFAPGEAVSITRRLYRSGDSEYLLNGRACRLRDIQDLFAGTGLSGGHYALVQQEKISQILSSKPSERRQLIEEAAGITKFRTRQRAAEVRLDSAKTNLRRISDIVSEIDKQANALRRQASRTRKFKELQETLRELLRKVFAAEAGELNNSLENLRDKLTAAISEENNFAATVQTTTENAAKATQTARTAEENLAEIRQTAAENALRRERVGRDFVHQTEQSKDLNERIAALEYEIKNLTERFEAVSADALRLREKNQQSNVSNETENAALKTAEEIYQKQIAEVRTVESNIEKVRQELFRHTTAAERFGEIYKQQTNALERIAERAAGLEKEGERAAATHAEKQSKASEIENKIVVARQHLQTGQAEKQKNLDLSRAAREELTAAEKTLSNVRDEANRVKTRRETLAKLDNQNALLAPAVQKLFAAADKIKINLHGTLADFVRVEPQFELAVEAVFGTNLQTVLVESNKDVEKIAAWLTTAKAGTLSLVVGGNSTGGGMLSFAGDSGTVGGLLEMSNDLRQILNDVLPNVLQFRIVKDLAEAAKFANENCVTLVGEIVRKNQFFAFAHQGEKQSGILSFKRELRELAARADALKSEIESAENAAKIQRETVEKRENAVLELQSGIVLAERELMSLELNSESLLQEIERAARHQKVVETEQARLESEQKDVAEKRAKALADGEIAETERRIATIELEKISKNLAEIRRSAEIANQNLSEQRAAFAAAGERRRSLSNALRRVESEQTEIQSRLQTRQNDLQTATARIEQIQKSLAELANQTANVDDEKEAEAAEIAAAAKELSSARSSADELTKSLHEANANAAQARDVRAALEVQQAEISTRFENLHEICQHDLNINLADLNVGTIEDFDLASGKSKSEDLREKLENFGAVNLLALEELGAADERLLFLTSQRKDIVDGITAAEAALDEIKRRSRQRFEFAFSEINRNFTELFSEIFGGGRGEMSLLDAADVLESGVEIVAQPPGKRLQNLLLLSGGEKALTAIALVLAIFRFRPAPFCLLDEVDAPLDEANVGRFIEKVAQMSEKTQFIVITHNKRTMESARALYGVTMEEAGISKIVSVKFE